ncbi:MAG: putative Ig domain-containing protein, partial [Candidatus Accumulibacter sp.]|nr:putative Ig domain-containing protein [Accumulibacter sp.]
MTWLLQAIDPLTGEVVSDPARGLLPPDNAQGAGRGFVTYTAVPRDGLATGTQISAQARVLFNTTAPLDTAQITYTLDARAPTSTLTANPVVQGGSDYRVQWSAQDDNGGSGVKSVSVYVAEDGGDYAIWKSQSTAIAGIYNGRAGHSYQFLALATDNAGNQEQPAAGKPVPSDDSRANLGGLPTVAETSRDFGTPPAPSAQAAVNPLFVQAGQGIPASLSRSRLPEFQSVVSPFTGQVFASGFVQSGADIGPLAILILPDGSLLASGGAARNQLFRFDSDGGRAATPLATLAQPIYDMALDGSANFIWATTGGGPLLKLDATSGEIVAQFGDGLTQSLAIQPGSGLVYASSANGIEVFDPASGMFTHFSDIRVGSLAFAPDGTLWAATWPHNQAQVIQFSGTPVKPRLMLEFNADVDSLAFGLPGSPLEGLLFVSHTEESLAGAGSELTMVDLATLKTVVLASGGTRGDQLKAGADGRVFISQSHQIDVLNPVRPPHVARINPPADATVALPFTNVAVTFDEDMLAGSAADPNSVLNPDNYRLLGDSAGTVSIRAIAYDQASRTAVLSFAPLLADHYQLQVLTRLRGSSGLALAAPYSSGFTAISDLSAVLGLDFSLARSDRASGTVSFDVTLINHSQYRLLLPVVLQLTPLQHFEGEPLGNQGRAADGSWLIDLSGNLPASGILDPGQTTTGRTISVLGPDRHPVAFDPRVSGRLAGNHAPAFSSLPPATAAAGAAYIYQPVAADGDGDQLSYLLVRSPAGMVVDATTGLLSWTPSAASPEQATVVLQVYDSAGAYDTQSFTVAVDGVNRAPWFVAFPDQISGREGQLLQVPIAATDPEGDSLVYWTEHLPPGAVFDAAAHALIWTPDFHAAGTYSDVRFLVSDGLHTLSESTTLVIAPTPQPPSFAKPANFTGREGDPIQIQLRASDVHGAALSFSSDLLPPGAFLDPQSGMFHWTPDATQHGVFSVPISVSNGQASTSQTLAIVVLNVNAAPAFENLRDFQIPEGQQIQFRAQAFDADNPTWVAPDRAADGTLVRSEAGRASLSYVASGLPAGATFDPETLIFTWTPGYGDAGRHSLTITATDDGDGGGQPLSAVQTVSLTVLNVNRAPQVDFIANTHMDHDTRLRIPVQAVDADGDPLSLSLVGLPAFGQFVDHGDGTAELTFDPGRDDRGNYTLSLRAVDNGDGNGSAAVLSGSQSFVLTVDAANVPPHLAPISNKVALVGQALQFTIQAGDGDQEPLAFSAVGLPGNASITPAPAYGRAVVNWTPTTADIGNYTILVKVADGGNGDPAQSLSDQQTFTLAVRTSNQAPAWISSADPLAPAGQTLALPLLAVDADHDPLTYSAANLPVGAALDPLAGILTWTPQLVQVGRYDNIVLTASDGNLATTRNMSITVTPVNEPPRFIPLPAQSGREGTLLQFTLGAADPNQDPLTFSARSALPAGAMLDAQSGRLQWTPDYQQAGNHVLDFAVTDPAGLTDSLAVLLQIDNVDRPPTLQVDNHGLVVGQPFSLQLTGADPDLATTLSYSANGLPAGSTLDAASGRFVWTPGPSQTGDFAVQFTVSDGELVVTRPSVLRVTFDPVPPPVLIELTPSFPGVPGSPVVVHAAASSIAPIAGLTLAVDGQPLLLDAHGRATYVPAAPGHYAIIATASDADGRVGTAARVLKVRDPNDQLPPLVSFDNLAAGSTLTSALDLRGTVSDSNLDTWVLDLAPLGSDRFTILASGDSSVSGVLSALDSGSLANGVYRLRLTASDISGRTTSTATVFDANTVSKPTRYQQADVDLSVSLGGTVVDLVRSYDSQPRDIAGTFSTGWRLVHRDSDIQTSVEPSGAAS